MDRHIGGLELVGLIIGALSCIAGWLALPQIQALLAPPPQRLGAWAVFGGLAALTLLLALAVFGWLARRSERVYLRALARHLCWINAMLLGGGRNESGTSLSIQAAFCPLTLLLENPEDAIAPSERAGRGARAGNLLGMREGRGPRAPITRAQRLAAALLWLATQAALLTWLLVLLVRISWPGTPGWGWVLSWSGLWAALLLALWLIGALAFHYQLLPWLRRRWQQRGECSAEPGSPGWEIFSQRRLLIKGSPGSGKTTLLHHMALLCAEARLEPRRRQLRKAYGWPLAPFPIYIPLRALRALAESGAEDLIGGYITLLREGRLLGTEMKRCQLDFLRRRLARGGCLLLIDGLDEVGDKLVRDRVAALIDALPAGSDATPNWIVVSSRKVGYEGQLQHLRFVHQIIRDLDKTQIEQFIQHRFAAFKQMREQQKQPALWDADERAATLLRRLAQNRSLRLLTGNPLLLSIVVGLDFRTNGRPLPRERHVLYRDMMELVVHDWEQVREQEAGLPAAQQEASRLDDQEKLRMLAELAWSMFERTLTRTDERSYLEIRRSDAETVLARVLARITTVAAAARRARVALDDFCRQQAEHWLDHLNEWGGVLKAERREVGSDEELLEFSHRTFQEYLAAWAIDRAATDQAAQRLRRMYDHWGDDRWQEVLLLYAAMRSNATPVITELLRHDTLPAWLLAGKVLIERPDSLDPDLRERVRVRLQHLALEDDTIDGEIAAEALGILAEAGEAPDEQALIQAACSAPHLAVRVHAVELLLGAESGRPAPEPPTPAAQRCLVELLRAEQSYQLRLAAGFALARGDPRYAGAGWLPELVEVPAGPFLMGSSAADKDAYDDEKPQHRRELPTYWIGTTPVTNAQWRRFMEAGGYSTRRYWTRAGWRWRRCGWEPIEDYSSAQQLIIIVLGRLFDPLVGLLLRRKPFQHPWQRTWGDPDFNGDNQPVVGISLYEAEAYCCWLSEASGHPFRLPTEEEWEKAARGPDGRIYPWGDTWQPGYCNSREQGLNKPAPVGSFPNGMSPCGAQDLAGNVWEWCSSHWRQNYPNAKADFSDRLINLLVRWGDIRCLRGGSWWGGRTRVRGAYRNFTFLPRYRNSNIGLRVASRSPGPDAES